MTAMRVAAMVFLFLLTVPGSPVRAEGLRVTITEFDCRRLVEYRPRDDVAYRPGIDVQGRAVVPADLQGGYQLDLPRVYRFDLTVQPFDLHQDRRRRPRHFSRSETRFHRDRPGRRHDADPRFEETGLVLGEIAIDAEGRAWFNGRRIQTEAQRELTRLCQSID